MLFNYYVTLYNTVIIIMLFNYYIILKCIL